MTGLTDVRDRTLTMLRSEGSAVIVDVLYDPDDLRAALTALLRQVGGKATIPGRDAAWAALDVKGRPRPQVRATRDAEPSSSSAPAHTTGQPTSAGSATE